MHVCVLHACCCCACHSVGGAAILLSNNAFDGFRAKYKLLSLFRYQNAADDAYNCVFQCQDADGNKGIHLSRDIVTVAGRALKHNLTLMGYDLI